MDEHILRYKIPLLRLGRATPGNTIDGMVFAVMQQNLVICASLTQGQETQCW